MHGMIMPIVIVLDLVLGVAVVVGGVYLLAGARGLSREWLRGTPFTSFVWPGLVLLVVVGGSLLAAATLLIVQAHVGRLVSVEAGVVFLGGRRRYSRLPVIDTGCSSYPWLWGSPSCCCRSPCLHPAEDCSDPGGRPGLLRYYARGTHWSARIGERRTAWLTRSRHPVVWTAR